MCAYLRATAPSTPKVEATALQPPSIASFTMFSGVEIIRILGEARAGGMFDALVHRQNREITSAAQPAVVEQPLQIAQHAVIAVETAKIRSTKSGPGRCKPFLWRFSGC